MSGHLLEALSRLCPLPLQAAQRCQRKSLAESSWVVALMNADNCALARGLVSASYVVQGAEALAKRQKLIKSLLSQRRLPQNGWDDATIDLFIQACRSIRATVCRCFAWLRGDSQAEGFPGLDGCLCCKYHCLQKER